MAGRRRTLTQFPLPESLWTVARAPWGGLCLLDERGRDVLRDPDPVRRLVAYHTAKQAPALLRAIEPLIHRVEFLRLEHHVDRESTDTAIADAWCAVWDRKPPADELRQAEVGRTQGEIDFSDDAA